MTWVQLTELTLSQAWLLTESVAGEWFRMTHLDPPAVGKLEIAQFNEDYDLFAPKVVLVSLVPEILLLMQPALFDQRRIGVRLLPTYTPWRIRLEVSDAS